MKTVRLKSRVGPTSVKLREMKPDGQYEVREYRWTIDNSSTTDMLQSDWQHLEHEMFNKRDRLTYKEAFIEL